VFDTNNVTGHTIVVECASEDADRLVEELTSRGLKVSLASRSPRERRIVAEHPSSQAAADADFGDRLADTAARTAQLRFEKAFQHSPDAIAINRQRDGLYIDVNEGLLSFLGYARDEVVGHTSKEIGAWVDPSARVRWIDALQRDGEVTNFEARFRRKDGSERIGLVSASVVSLDGEAHVLSTTRDITERKASQEALHRAAERLHLAQRSARAGLWDWDMATGTLTWSPELYELFGLPSDVPATFDLWRTALHPDDRDEAQRRTFDAVRERVHLASEYRVVVGDDIRWVQAAGNTVFDAEGNGVRMSGICLDITERKRVEQRLRESDQLLRNLARLVPGVIYQFCQHPDGHLSIPYASPGIDEIFEVAPEDVRDDASPIFARLHPDDVDRVSEAIQQSAQTLETFLCEFRTTLPHRGLRWVSCQAHPERTADGSTLWHGIATDVTDRKQADAERTALETQLQHAQKMESVGRLAGGVAHDFNNMLAVILGHAELALDRVEPTHPIIADVQEIRQAATRSANLTRQLLAFARRQNIAPRVLDLNQTIEGMLRLLDRLIGEDVSLVWRPGTHVRPVKLDPSQIDQVLTNLCVNARDAIAGVGRVIIETDMATLDEAYCAEHVGFTPGVYAVLAVSDNGCGMDAETRAHIFEPFFSTKGIGEGTGLGLAMVYGIVRQNNGFINVYSEPGVGSTFRIYLPSADGSDVDVTRTRPDERLSHGSETILVVEDEPANLKLIRLMLESLGYAVLAAGSPADAIELAGRHGADIRLLLTDVVMPQMNGRELAERVSRHCPTLTTVFMSGYTANVIAHRGVLDHGLHFLQKPFAKADLAATVRAALDAQAASPGQDRGDPSSNT